MEIDGDIGETEVLILHDKSSSHMMVLGHGAGAGMEHAFMHGLAHMLLTKGISTLRYNFPYIHNGKKRPDSPNVAHKTILSAIEVAEAHAADKPLILAGKSFGGRMGSQTAAKYHPTKVKALVFYGFPLHAPGKPGIERANHLKEIDIPMLFLQGSRDTFAQMDLLQPLLKSLEFATLDVLEGADHGFKFLKRTGINEVKALELLAEHTRSFLDSLS